MDPVVLTVDNRNIRVAGLPTPIAKRVSTLTSYLQAGYEHSKAFQGHWWDGRRRLATMRADGSLQAPVGLAEEIVGIMREQGVHFKVEDRRRLPGYRLGLKYQGKPLRPYQLQAVREAMSSRGFLRMKGRGVIKMPPRSGKTMVAAAIMAELNVRALFVVPALTLLYQSQAELQDSLQVPVGLIGDQMWAPADITVATVQTLVARRGKNTRREPAAPEYLDLLRKVDLVIMDECFPAGTLVGNKPIEALRAGERVPAFNEKEQQIEKKKVLRVFERRCNRLVTLHFAGGRTLVCTPNHPVYIPSGWRQAGSLQAGSEVLSIHGSDALHGMQQAGLEGEAVFRNDGGHESAEKGLFTWARVDRVEVHEPGSDGTFERLCPNGMVYNLEVEQLHTYVADGFVVHNCHHLEAELWRQVMRDAGAAYQLGLSATAFPDHEHEQELGVIWLRACTGDLLIDISASDLIELGYLVQPEIRFYPMRMPANLQQRGWSQRLYREAIVANRARNELVARVTCELVAEGWQPAVISNRLEQVGAITRMLDRSRVPFARLTGQTDRATRKRQIERFRAGELRALVGTVLDEGVDIPELDAVVNAEGGADIKATYQRLRCMTVAPGKTRALVVDFMDLMHPIFADHSLARLRVYQGERAFRVLAAAA